MTTTSGAAVNRTHVRNARVFAGVGPGKQGIAAFSPPLDDGGTIVRSRTVVAHTASQLGLSLFAVRSP